MHLTRQIRVDAFLSNVDPLIMLVWIAGGLVKIAVSFTVPLWLPPRFCGSRITARSPS